MARNPPPTIHFVAGPNGAGKTTFARSFLPEYGCRRFLNADLIAAGLGSAHPPKLVAEIRKEEHLINDLKTYEKIKQAIQSR